MNTLFINGSPKKEGGCSAYIISETLKIMKDETAEHIRPGMGKNLEAACEKVLQAKNICFVFPLYFDSVPSHLLRFMRELEKYAAERKTEERYCYAVVNSGFFESSHNESAIEAVKCFAARAGFKWRFGIGIGGGPFMVESRSMPMNFFVKRPVYGALCRLKDDMENKSGWPENIFVSPAIFRKMYILMAHASWLIQARKNGLKSKDIYRAPEPEKSPSATEGK